MRGWYTADTVLCLTVYSSGVTSCFADPFGGMYEVYANTRDCLIVPGLRMSGTSILDIPCPLMAQNGCPDKCIHWAPFQLIDSSTCLILPPIHTPYIQKVFFIICSCCHY